MKLGILGTGMIVEDFLTIASEIKGIQLTAVCNVRSDKEAINSFAASHQIQRGFCDWAEFIGSDIDTVYVALPNSLHFFFGKMALEAGKNVIIEKPFTSNYKEAVILAELAKEKQLFLFEAITNQYLPNYYKIKELIGEIGAIKIVQCNYSQYSSRYDSFKGGTALPAFDPKLSGGALMDLNIYNIHYVVGLFGEPYNVEYYPNMERGIDTSGILILSYEGFQCVCIGAKDCKAPAVNLIQGERGYIRQDTPANVCSGFHLITNEGRDSFISENTHEHRMVEEFLAFEDMIAENKLDHCQKMLEHSLIVSKIQTTARKKAEIVFEADV